MRALYGCFVLTYEPQVISVLCSQNIDDNDSPDEIPSCYELILVIVVAVTSSATSNVRL